MEYIDFDTPLLIPGKDKWDDVINNWNHNFSSINFVQGSGTFPILTGIGVQFFPTSGNYVPYNIIYAKTGVGKSMLKPIQPTKSYKVGDLIPKSREGFPRVIGYGCRFCGELETSQDGGYLCGYSAEHYDKDHFKINSICSRYSPLGETAEIVSRKPCDCSMITLLQKGCQCGGI